jgi:hypothetical protein
LGNERKVFKDALDIKLLTCPMQPDKPKSQLQENLIICVVLLLVSAITTYFGCRSCRSSLEWFAKFAGFTASLWISLWMGNAYTSDWVSRFVSWTAEPVKRFWVGMLVMVVYTSGTVYLLIIIFRNTFDFDVGDSDGMIYGSLIVTFIITSFMHGRGFLTNWKQAALDAEAAKRESIRAQYEVLKNQVNPHFLFNSLNVLTGLVYQDADKAVLFIKKLSEVYRYVLDTRNQELILLRDELSFVESYVYLQQIRFGENLTVQMPQAREGQVVPLAVQMLIENAIKHNELSSDYPLHIAIIVADDYLTVRNNLQLKTMPMEEGSGLGLANIQKRYEFLTDKSVLINQADAQFEVKIPIIKTSL